MCITKAVVADTNELTDLINSAYRGESSKAGWTNESHLLEGSRIDDLTMLSYLQDDNIAILKYVDDGAIKGCVYLEPKEGKLYIGMLTVSPLSQANGIGRKLLQAAEEYGKELGLNTVFMTVITSRHELLNWYERRGFQSTGEVKPFHVPQKFGIAKEPFDIVVLQKQIK